MERIRLLCLPLVFLAVSNTASRGSAKSDPNEFLRQVVAKLGENDAKSENFTFIEDLHNVNYDGHGKVTLDETAKYETIFVEGTPYKRQLEANGKPLSPEAAAEEERKYQATVAERRRMNSELKQTKFHRSFEEAVVWDSWPLLFEASPGGEDVVEGHFVTVLRLSPRPKTKPASESQKDSLHTSIQLWINNTDELPIRVRIEYTSDGVRLLRGSVVELDFLREPRDGTYLQSRFSTDYRIKALGAELRGHSEQKFSNFRRFSVDVRMAPQTANPQ